MAELNRTVPIVPKYPKPKPLPREQFAKEIELRINRLQMQLNDLQLLVREYLEQD